MAHFGSRDAGSYRRVFDELLVSLAEACGAVYGDRLVSLAVFGSVGRDVCPGWTSSTGSRSG